MIGDEIRAVVDWMRANSEALYRHASDHRIPVRDRLEFEIVARRDRMVADAIERRDYLLHRPTASDASTDRTPATVGGCGKGIE